MNRKIVLKELILMSTTWHYQYLSFVQAGTGCFLSPHIHMVQIRVAFGQLTTCTRTSALLCTEPQCQKNFHLLHEPATRRISWISHGLLSACAHLCRNSMCTHSACCIHICLTWIHLFFKIVTEFCKWEETFNSWMKGETGWKMEANGYDLSKVRD